MKTARCGQLVVPEDRNEPGGRTITLASGFDQEYGLQIDSGVAAGGGDLYVYRDEGDAEKAISDIEAAYKFSEPEIVGTAVLVYSQEDAADVRDDVTECIGS